VRGLDFGRRRGSNDVAILKINKPRNDQVINCKPKEILGERLTNRTISSKASLSISICQVRIVPVSDLGRNPPHTVQ
jgi:hypothetical protein